MLVTLYHYLESCNKKKVYSHLIGGKSLPSKVLRNCHKMCPPYIKKMAEEAEQQVLAPTTCLKVIGWKELSFCTTQSVILKRCVQRKRSKRGKTLSTCHAL